MGINLRGVDIGMSQHHLDRTQIDAVIDQMRGKSMAQTVRTERSNTGRFGIFFDYHPCKLTADAAAFLADKHFVADFVFQQQRARFVAIAFHPIRRFLPQRNQTQFVALAYGTDTAAM